MGSFKKRQLEEEEMGIFQDEQIEEKDMQTKVNKEMLLHWLGSDNTLEESLTVILEMVNDSYTPKELREDIISHDDFAILKESGVR